MDRQIDRRPDGLTNRKNGDQKKRLESYINMTENSRFTKELLKHWA